MIAVKPIEPGQGPVLLDLVRTLAEHHELMAHFEASAEQLEAALFAADSFVGCFIAWDHGKPAGYAFWHRSFATFRGREVLYLEDIAVAPSFRRRGVGEALFRAVARLAVSRGYPSIYWLMMAWNEEARAFYRKLGADSETGLEFWRIHGEALKQLARDP